MTSHSRSVSKKKLMSANKHTLLYTLILAALMLPLTAEAAKKSDDGDGPAACDDCPDYSGWSGWVEGGLGAQSSDDVHFGRYIGRESRGGTINADGAVRYRAKDGRYADLKAVDLGLTSRDLQLDGGVQGKYGAAFEYDQIPNYRIHDAFTPFQGGGTLPAGWVAGSNTGAMAGLSGALVQTSLKTQRDRTGVKFNYIPVTDWEVTGFFRHEKKEGTRDVGASFGFGSISILPAPVDFQTDDFGMTVGYKGRKLQGQLVYTGSFFKNGNAAINFANPYSVPIGVATGAIAESPDNQSHQLSGLLAYQLSESTRIGANLAIGRMTQNQAFLPYSSNPGFGMPSTSSLDGRVDTTQAKFDISSRPALRWQLNASYTYSNRDDKTDVHAYQNVITDAYQSYSPTSTPGTSAPVTRNNRPYSFEQRLLRTSAAYALSQGANLSAGFDDNQMNRSYQPVQKTDDRTLWTKLKLHPTESIETTLKYSYSTRDASAYATSSPAAAFQNSLFPESGVGNANPLMTAFEYADRRRNKVGFEVSTSPLPQLSLDLSVDYYRDDYPKTVLGLNNAKGTSVTPSATYVFSDRLSSSLYYSYEKLDSGQASSYWMTAPATSTLWAESDSNLTQTVGLNLTWKAIPKKLDLGADLAYSDFTGKIHYVGTTDLPDLGSRMTSIGIHGTYKLKDQLSLRAGYRYEKYSQSDWAAAGAASTLPQLLSMGTVPQNSETSLVTVSLRYDFK